MSNFNIKINVILKTVCVPDYLLLFIIKGQQTHNCLSLSQWPMLEYLREAIHPKVGKVQTGQLLVNNTTAGTRKPPGQKTS